VAIYYLSISDVKMRKRSTLLPHFPELLPLVLEKQGIGGRIIEIREVVQNKGGFFGGGVRVGNRPG
jgi:hypothetical protein